MDNKEIQAIEEIKGTGGFRVITSMVEDRLKTLDSVSTVDESKLVNIEAVFLGKKYAVKFLKDFLSDLNLTSKPQGETKRTYE